MGNVCEYNNKQIIIMKRGIKMRMQNVCKKAISVGLSVMLLATSINFGGIQYAKAEETTIVSGVGEEYQWTLKDGELTFSPLEGNQNGTITNDAVNDEWKSNYADQITSIKVDSNVTINLTNGGLFRELKNLGYADFSNVKFKGSMGNLLSTCKKLKTVILTGTDWSGVTTMKSAFFSCASLKNIVSQDADNTDYFDFRGLDFSNVTSFNQMLYGCGSCEMIDFSGHTLNQGDKVDFSFSFYDIDKLVSVDLSGLKANNVNFGSAFRFSDGLKYVNFSNAEITGDVNFGDSFRSCSKLESVNFKGSNIINATSVSGMFAYCRKLKELDATYINWEKEGMQYSSFATDDTYGILIIPKNVKADLVNYINNRDGKWVAVAGGTVENPEGDVLYNNLSEVFAANSEISKDKETYVFKPTISDNILDRTNGYGINVSTDSEYSGNYRTVDEINLIVEYMGRIAVEGVDYTVSGGPKVGNSDKWLVYYEIDALEGGMFAGGSIGNSKVKNVRLQKATPIINLSDINTVYNAEAVQVPDFTVTGNVKDNLPTDPGTFAFYSDAECTKEIEAPVNAGTYYGKVTTAEDKYYKAGEKVITITIEKATPILNLESGVEFDYTGSSPSFDQFSVIDPITGQEYECNPVVEYFFDSNCIYKTQPIDARDYTVRVTIPETDNYNGVSDSTLFTIKPVKPNVIANDQNYKFTNNPINYTNYSISGLTNNGQPIECQPTGKVSVNFYNDPEHTDLCKLGKPVYPGTYYVVVSIEAKGNYAAASDEAVVVIEKGDAYIYANDQVETYTGKPIPYTNYYVCNFNRVILNNDEISYYTDPECSEALDGAPVNAGTYYVIIKYCDNGLYKEKVCDKPAKLTITKAQSSVEVNSVSVKYDGDRHGLNPVKIEGEADKDVTVVYYKDSMFANKTNEEDGAAFEGGEPSEPGTYYTKVALEGGENYLGWVADDFTLEITRPATIEINGCQINYRSEGFRTVYTLDNKNDDITEVGLIYSIDLDDPYKPEGDMTLDWTNIKNGKNNPIAYAYAASEKGLVATEPNKNIYAMTMKFVSRNQNRKAFFQCGITVRPYYKDKNGNVVYGKQKKLTVYDIASKAYKDSMMPTQEGHDYLYNEILKVVNPDYIKVEFGDWSPVIPLGE